MNIPQDRKLIQESLEQVAKGPQALLDWARKHADEIDQKFMNQLHRMVEYAQKTNQEQLYKTFTFLEQCFNKMFALDAMPAAIAITKENFRENFEKANRLLSVGKADAALAFLKTLNLFLAQSPIENAMALVEANIGIAYGQLAKYDEAVTHLQQSLNQPLNDIAKEKILANLGMVLRQQKKYIPSIDIYKQALELAKQRDDKEMQFIHLNNLALVYLDQKNLEKALESQQEAYQIGQNLQNAKLIQDCLTRLAVLHALQGDTQKCQELCQEGLKAAPLPTTKDYLNLGLE